MALAIKKFTKQSIDILDYDFDFTLWFGDRADTIDTYTVTVDSGITKISDSKTDTAVKVLLSGGTNGDSYKVTVAITTVLGLVKETEALVLIRDI